MRQETNNEMDLLLRRLGRQQETSAPGDHLDADELNLYAENVLPPAARARYTEHLAECAQCREFVIQLSSSAGVVVSQETARVSEPSALRKFLASLLSPMVLRYAVPALGLVVVAAIGFMVTRNEAPLNSPVAEVHEPVEAPVPASQPQQPSSSPEKESHALADGARSVNKAGARGDTAAETGGAAPPPPNAAPVVSSVDAEVRNEAKVEQQQAEAKEAPPPAKATPAISALKKADPETQKQPSEGRVVVANEPAAEEKARTQDRSASDVASASSRPARGRGETRGLAGLQAGDARVKREDTADKDKNDAEIRTVAGRRFRKQGSVWIDTAYSSSRSTTNLTRGSEGYRALVADEPEIKRIADELDGEIVVVWRGRAYRIR